MSSPREVVAEHLRSEHSIEWGVNGLPLDDFFADTDRILSALRDAGYSVVRTPGVAACGPASVLHGRRGDDGEADPHVD